MYLNKSGNLGIGKTPEEKLDVDGKIKNTSLEVTGDIHAGGTITGKEQ